MASYPKQKIIKMYTKICFSEKNEHNELTNAIKRCWSEINVGPVIRYRYNGLIYVRNFRFTIIGGSSGSYEIFNRYMFTTLASSEALSQDLELLSHIKQRVGLIKIKIKLLFYRLLVYMRICKYYHDFSDIAIYFLWKLWIKYRFIIIIKI